MNINKVECPIFLPNPGDRIRLLLRYQETWRPIFWFKLAKDGSVYLGPRLPKISELKKGKAKSLGNNQFRVQYADGELITNPDLIKQAKLSFHASGVVNVPGDRISGEVLRSLKEQILLCFIILRHPKHFDAIDDSKIKKRDVCLNCPIDENRPLWAQLWIAPNTKVEPIIHDSVNWQLNSIFCYQNLKEIQNLTLQFVLAYGTKGPWPDWNVLAFTKKITE